MDWSNCDGKWWEEFTPCDADHVGICENLLGNLICSKNLDQLYTGGHFLFLKGRPKISTLLLISWPWSSGPSCWEQDHQSHPPLFTFTNPSPALLVLHSTSGKVVLDIKNQRMNSICTMCIAHVITSPYIWEWEWDAPNCSGMIKRYWVFDCHIYNI